MRTHLQLLPVVAALFPAAASGQQGTLIGTWPNPAHPTGNPADATRATLGKALFWDEQLSSDGTMSCGTCHILERGGADPRPGGAHPNGNTGSFGVIRQNGAGNYIWDPHFGVDRQVTPLNAPTVINSAFFEELFWDSRAKQSFTYEDGTLVPQMDRDATLESLSVQPPISAVEMGHDGVSWASIEDRLVSVTPLEYASNLTPELSALQSTTYHDHFFYAFGPAPVGEPVVSRERIAMALAQYMRTLVSDEAPIDAGLTALTADAQAGFELFNLVDPGGSGDAGSCASCHSAQTLDPPQLPVELDGNGHFVEANDLMFSMGVQFDIVNQALKVKTPSLRNLTLRGRMFHTGQFDDLEGSLSSHYFDPHVFLPHGFANAGSSGGGLTAAQEDQVRAFLAALTDRRVALNRPPFDRPTLRSEVVEFGSNLHGSGSTGVPGRPVMIANAPPKIGNDAFKLGVGNTLNGSVARLWMSPALGSEVHNGVHWEIDRTQKVQVGAVWASSPDPNDPGVGTLHIDIPDDPSLVGTTQYFQWHVADPSGSGGFATTQAARIDYF